MQTTTRKQRKINSFEKWGGLLTLNLVDIALYREQPQRCNFTLQSLSVKLKGKEELFISKDKLCVLRLNTMLMQLMLIQRSMKNAVRVKHLFFNLEAMIITKKLYLVLVLNDQYLRFYDIFLFKTKTYINNHIILYFK